jgi:hypothetical protein
MADSPQQTIARVEWMTRMFGAVLTIVTVKGGKLVVVPRRPFLTDGEI